MIYQQRANNRPNNTKTIRIGLPIAAFEFIDYEPALTDMRGAVLEGLARQDKQVSPMYFYDQAGSELFEQITALPEYYPTRTEIALFEKYGADIADIIGQDVVLVEYGSGSSRKIRKLLETARPRAYVPVDISGEHLLDHAKVLRADFPWLDIYPTCADFTQPFDLPEATRGLTRAGFFPGSSVGNFEPKQAVTLLQNMHATLGDDAYLLIGVDRKKDAARLEAAYDDAAGVTARFNLNVLRHLNDKLAANFDLAAFKHKAIYNEDIGAIQMFLVSQKQQSVRVAGQSFKFQRGETLHTENSFKYHPEEFAELASRAGFTQVSHWTDTNDWFSVFLLRARSQAA